MRQALINMLTLQDKMNTRVHEQWALQNFEWYRAIWIECGELIEHFGYKWWKKQETDIEQVRLEVIDIWHFGLSALFVGDKDIIAIADDMAFGGGQIDAAFLGRPGAVFEIAVHRALPVIEIEGDHALARIGERDRDMDRRGRLARPALLVGEGDRHDAVWAQARLQRHLQWCARAGDVHS